MHPADLDDGQLLAQCDVRRLRRGGPGGQHRNKTSSAVVLKHVSTGVIAEANERRDQSVNLRQALFRLRVNLALEVRVARAATPSELWKSRCGGGRLHINGRHADFPRLLAEALDLLALSDDDAKKAAGRLGCTLTQWVKLVSLDPRALNLVNGRRATLGLHPLRPRSGS